MVFKQPVSGAQPVSAYYDDAYAESDYWNDEPATTRALGALLAAVAGVAPVGATLLDIGCGAGAFLRIARAAGYRVTGLELNASLAQRARDTSGAEVVVGDAGCTTLAGRRFDVVTVLDLIEHVPDPVGVLRRCADALTPGGHLVVYTPNHSSVIARAASGVFRMSGGRVRRPVTEIFDGLHVAFFNRRTLRLAVEKASLAVVRVSMIKYDPARSRQAGPVASGILRLLEAVSPLVEGQFRILLIARRPDAA